MLCLLRAWLLSFCEGAGRLGPWFSTAILRSLPGAAQFFRAVDDAALEALRTDAGPRLREGVLQPALLAIAQDRAGLLGKLVANLDKVRSV